jgi:hypothetical protein
LILNNIPPHGVKLLKLTEQVRILSLTYWTRSAAHWPAWIGFLQT